MINETHNITLKTLSPIHIGSGDIYNSSEFVSLELRNPKAKSKNDSIKIIKRINFFKYYSDLSEDKQNEFLDLLSTPNFNLKDFDSKINKKYNRYLAFNKTKSTNINEIKEHIKTSDKLYIPGSSIKGAVKTAILYDLIINKDIDKINNKYFFNDGRWINPFFSSKEGNPAQNSILRFMQIGDTNTINNPNIDLIFTVMAIPNERNNKKFEYYDEGKSFLETIPKNKVFNTNINFTFDSKIYRRLGINDKEYLLDINYLKNVLYEFSCDLIEYELEFANNYDVDFLYNFYDNLYAKNSKNEPLIRVGAGSGLMSTTILMKIKNYDKYKFNEIRKSKLFKKTYPYEFPKSRRINKFGQPLGWIKLKFD